MAGPSLASTMFSVSAARSLLFAAAAALLAGPSSVAAFPGKSGLCTVTGAEAALAAVGGMSPASQIATPFTITANPVTYNPGDMITITISGGTTYTGFLGYATGSMTTMYVGTWTIPTGYQNNDALCKTAGIMTENVDSTITHTAGQKFNGGTLMYKAPAGAVGDLSFNFIFVDHAAGGGYAHAVMANAVTVKAAGGTNGAATTTMMNAVVTTPCCGGKPFTVTTPCCGGKPFTITSSQAAPSSVVTPCCGGKPYTVTMGTTTGGQQAPSSTTCNIPTPTVQVTNTVTFQTIVTAFNTVSQPCVTVTNVVTVPVTSSVPVTKTMTATVNVNQVRKCSMRVPIPPTPLVTACTTTTGGMKAPSATPTPTMTPTMAKTTTTTSCTTTTTTTSCTTTTTMKAAVVGTPTPSTNPYGAAAAVAAAAPPQVKAPMGGW
ncbi:hypothetical protein DFJ73DRAFT_841298 [Zopfochytrium polystomum]|nr:hypothetical protein DFJ73DRAFT_841298 [Zopfochytrium polystomum]